MTTTTADIVQIKLPRPHSDGQKAMLDLRYNIVAFCGRRYGKTQAGVYRILKAATKVIGLYWWVGLSWRSASMKRAWRLLKFYVRKVWKALGNTNTAEFISESTKELTLPNGSAIWLRSAEREDSLAGEGIRGVVIDEFSLMTETVWTEYIEATLIDYEGWALFIGVPKGVNWASNLWRAASGRDGWKALRFTTYDNPKMPRHRIDDIQLHTTERTFKQEYLAEILDDGGAVFRNIRECIYQETKRSGDVVFGVDWGKVDDYTVIVAMDKNTRQIIEYDRFNQIDWNLQRGRLAAMAARLKPSLIIAEENSIGEPNIEELVRSGLPVEGFKTTAASKPPLIDGLALGFEQRSIGMIEDDYLINELQAFTVEKMPGGSYRYSAPNGMHDDTVIALALAWHAANTRAAAGISKSQTHGLFNNRSRYGN